MSTLTCANSGNLDVESNVAENTDVKKRENASFEEAGLCCDRGRGHPPQKHSPCISVRPKSATAGEQCCPRVTAKGGSDPRHGVLPDCGRSRAWVLVAVSNSVAEEKSGEFILAGVAAEAAWGQPPRR